MKTFFSFIFFGFIFSFQHLLFNIDESKSQQIGEDSLLTANLCFVGDLMCHSTQFNYAKVDADSFDFTGVFREVKKYLTEPDLTVGNLETVIAGKDEGYSGYPYFNAPDDFIYALKDAGFNLLITANNHALDQGVDGVNRTIDVINKNKIYRTGTFTSQTDRDSIRIFMINSIKIAIIAYSENINGTKPPKGNEYIINYIDEEKLRSDIQKARMKNVDIVLVHLHYGTEYKREPTDFQKEIVKKIISFGADIIIGGHPHVIQPFDYFRTNNTKLDTGFVAYSMGNFVSNQRWRYSDAGVILNIQISKNKFTDSVYISNINFLPTWVFRGNTDKGKEYIILPSTSNENDSSFFYLSNTDKKLLNEAFSDTKEIVTKYHSYFKLITSK